MVAVTNRDTLFHIYDKEFNHQASIGKKGRGPTEFPMPPVIEDVYKQNGNIKALIYNQFRRELIVIDISSSFKEGELIVKHRVELPKKLWGLSNIRYLGSSEGYIGIYEDRNQKRIDGKRGGFYATPQLEKFDFFPLKNLSVEPYQMSPAMNVNGRTPELTPNREKFVTLLAYFPLIEVIDITKREKKQYLLESNPPDSVFELENFKSGETVRYHRDMYATDNHIYILTTNELINSGKQKIKVIDLMGKAEAVYEISEEYELSSIIVDEERKKIYGTSYRNDTAYIFEY